MKRQSKVLTIMIEIVFEYCPVHQVTKPVYFAPLQIFVQHRLGVEHVHLVESQDRLPTVARTQSSFGWL